MTPGLDALSSSFTRHGAGLAMEFLDGDQWCYDQLWSEALAFGDRLQDVHGLRRGDSILVQYKGAKQAVLYLLAAAQKSWRICPISPDASERHLQHALDLVRPRLYVDRHGSFQLRENSVSEAEPGDGFLVALSSGSTGQPKAILHSLERYVASAVAFGALSGFSTQTRLLHVLPWVYMAGIMNAWLAPLMCGATVLEDVEFEALSGAHLALRALTRGANTLSLVPIMASTMVSTTRNAEVIAEFSQRIQQVQCTSAPIPAGLRKAFLDKFGVPLRDCYGITEVGGPVSLQSHEDAFALSDFSLPSRAYRLSLADDGAQSAELLIDTPFAMLGYLNQGRVGLQAPQPFPSGDLAVLQSGRMRIVGRIKDLVIRGGYNISPQYIESIVSLCTGVREAALIGYEVPMVGERMALFVSLWTDTPAARASLKVHLASELSKVERPDKVLVVPTLPRLYNGKLDKPTLRKQVEP